MISSLSHVKVTQHVLYIYIYIYIYICCIIALFVYAISLTHCGRVTQICVFNTVKLGTSASSP